MLFPPSDMMLDTEVKITVCEFEEDEMPRTKQDEHSQVKKNVTHSKYNVIIIVYLVSLGSRAP